MHQATIKNIVGGGTTNPLWLLRLLEDVLKLHKIEVHLGNVLGVLVARLEQGMLVTDDLVRVLDPGAFLPLLRHLPAIDEIHLPEGQVFPDTAKTEVHKNHK